jgi:hypothetical protein
MLCYQLPHVCPAAHGLFARHAGAFLIHPCLLGKDYLPEALAQRRVQFLRAEEGLIPLVPILWLIERYPSRAEDLHRLEAYLALRVIRGQAAHDYPLETLNEVALPENAASQLKIPAGVRAAGPNRREFLVQSFFKFTLLCFRAVPVAAHQSIFARKRRREAAKPAFAPRAQTGAGSPAHTRNRLEEVKQRR